MRDQRFIAEHRGGPLTMERHRQLISWSAACARHVLPLFGKKTDERLPNALIVSKKWAAGKASVGDARQASVAAHAVARASANPAAVAVARAVGHAVATAHMADHSPGGALYALRAVNQAGKSVEVERKWQQNKLPSEIKQLVLSAMRKKEEHFKF